MNEEREIKSVNRDENLIERVSDLECQENEDLNLEENRINQSLNE